MICSPGFDASSRIRGACPHGKTHDKENPFIGPWSFDILPDFLEARIALYPASYLVLVFQVLISEFAFKIFLLTEHNTTLKSYEKHRKKKDEPQ